MIWKWPEILLLQKQIFVEVVQNIAVLKNFLKINRKRPVQESLFKTSFNLVRKETLTLVFSSEFWKFFKNTFIAESSRLTASALPEKLLRKYTKTYQLNVGKIV